LLEHYSGSENFSLWFKTCNLSGKCNIVFDGSRKCNPRLLSFLPSREFIFLGKTACYVVLIVLTDLYVK